jgi:hypothetical protein
VKSARLKAHENCKASLRIGRETQEGTGYSTAVRAVLRHYYLHYDDYDMLTFPILYNSGVGEASYVEVVRFSPDDATKLIDETNITRGEVSEHDSSVQADSAPKTFRCSKLAGAAFGHFGAFLNRQWRRNDILWGRLDGAERIISTLLPDRPAEAGRLIGEAQAAIVCDVVAELCGIDVSQLGVHRFTRPERDEVYALLTEAFMHPRLGRKHDGWELRQVKRALSRALCHFVAELRHGAKDTEWEAPLAKAIRDKELFEYFDDHYAPGAGLFRQLGTGNTWRGMRTLVRLLRGTSLRRTRRGQIADKGNGTLES